MKGSQGLNVANLQYKTLLYILCQIKNDAQGLYFVAM